MNTFFEIGFVFCFLLASVVMLLQSSKRKGDFSKEEKIRTISFSVAFFLGMFVWRQCGNMIASAMSLAGLVVSEFTAAFVFYDYYKDKEIPHE